MCCVIHTHKKRINLSAIIYLGIIVWPYSAVRGRVCHRCARRDLTRYVANNDRLTISRTLCLLADQINRYTRIHLSRAYCTKEFLFVHVCAFCGHHKSIDARGTKIPDPSPWRQHLEERWYRVQPYGSRLSRAGHAGLPRPACEELQSQKQRTYSLLSFRSACVYKRRSFDNSKMHIHLLLLLLLHIFLYGTQRTAFILTYDTRSRNEQAGPWRVLLTSASTRTKQGSYGQADSLCLACLSFLPA